MSLNNPRSGTNVAAEFTMSGLPWVVSGTTVSNTVTSYQLPKVTKNITFHNLSTTSNKFIRVGFTLNGVNGVGGNYYFSVNSGETVTLDARVKEVHVRGDTFTDTLNYSLYCSLTMIDSTMMPILTGSIGGTTMWEGIG